MHKPVTLIFYSTCQSVTDYLSFHLPLFIPFCVTVLQGFIWFYPFFTQEEEKVSPEFLAGKVPEIVYQKAIQCIPGMWSV